MAQPPLHDELMAISAELDRLLADMATGLPSSTRHDGYVEQVEEMARRMLVAARGPARSINPPLRRYGAGKALW